MSFELASLSRELIAEASSLDTIATMALESAKRITCSPHGFAAVLDPKSGALVARTLTQMLPSCEITGTDRRVVFTPGADGRFGALFGVVLNERVPVLTNTPWTHPSSTGVPEGHVPLASFLSVPVMFKGALVGQIAVANAPDGYASAQVVALERIAELFALAIARQAGDEERDRLIYDLSERIKELKCLTALSALAHEDKPLRELLAATAQLVPPAFLRPARTSCRLVVDGEEHLSTPFVNATTRLSARIEANRQRRGILEIHSTVEGTLESGEAFLPEERVLVDTVAQLIGQLIARDDSLRALHEAAALHSSILNASPDAVAVIDKEGVVQFASPRFALLRGEDGPEALLGQSIFDLIEHQHLERAFGLFAKARRGDGRHEAPLSLLRRDGGAVAVDISAAALSGTESQRGSAVLVIRDATLRRQAELALRRAYEEQVLFLDMLRISVVAVSSDGVITYSNRSARELFGIGDEALTGHYGDVLGLAKAEREAVAHALARKESVRQKLELRVRTLRGVHRIELDIRDDTRVPERSLFFIYDRSEVYELRQMLGAQSMYQDMVGHSHAMQEVFRTIEDVATVDWTVLIHGPTGSGKELVARAIHARSHRKGGPFVPVNCAGLNDGLLASQLFGHRRGSFTGAVDDHKGFFELAHGGTLFLDEIGDISSALQMSLLRVLEDKTVTRLGDAVARTVDVRILAATHKDLIAESEAGRFRADLLYRLRSARVVIPPLSKRREDIPLLVEHFLRRCRASTGKDVREIGAETMRRLLAHPWPGNIRELKSTVEFAVLQCRSSVILPEDLPREIEGPSPTEPPRTGRTSAPPVATAAPSEHDRIRDALERCGGNRNEAARLLGMSRATLFRRLRAMGLSDR